MDSHRDRRLGTHEFMLALPVAGWLDSVRHGTMNLEATEGMPDVRSIQ